MDKKNRRCEYCGYVNHIENDKCPKCGKSQVIEGSLGSSEATVVFNICD